MVALENNNRRFSFLRVVRSGLPTLFVSIVIAALTSGHSLADDQETKKTTCRNAAGYHVSGFGVDYDDLDADRAIALCRAAMSETPNDVSLFPYLARALQKKGDEPSISEALKLAQVAAERHDAEGMTRLANLLENGVGVPKDLKKAASLHSEASEAHFVPAQFNLSLLYAEGLGVDKNEAKSLELLSAAAAADYGPALERLAALHYNRKVPDASPAKARELMSGPLLKTILLRCLNLPTFSAMELAGRVIWIERSRSVEILSNVSLPKQRNRPI
jgi:Sel1 repeat